MRRILLTLLIVCTSVDTWSANYYRLKNVSGDNYMTEVIPGNTLACMSLIENSYAQIWEITSSGYGSSVNIRNALSQRYVQSRSEHNVPYTTGTTAYQFTRSTSNGVTTFADSRTEGLHRDANNNVVLWDTSEDKSKWIMEAVTIDESALAAARNAMTAVAASTLTQFFTTTACTALNSYYAAMTDAQLRSAMSSLPTTVQEMAIKVKNNAWTTYGNWNKTEKTYRIADYSAYSRSTTWAGALVLSYPLGRLSNPTGIYVHAGDVLQVYVGNIPTGESVALEVAGFNQASGTLYWLERGMNIINVVSEGNAFVYYEVDNYNNGNPKSLSSYADVTVHIEGGTVQGCFDLTKGYTNSDWTQLKQHLMSCSMFTMKTMSLVFNLQTSYLLSAVDGQTSSGYDAGEIVELLTKWQSIQDMEDRIMGRYVHFPETQCNNVHSVTTVSGEGWLYASNYGIYFSTDQHSRLFNNDRFNNGYDELWASSHELGHHRQKLINMAGLTEVSNNIFSNVAIYEQGLYTSRTASIHEVFSDWQKGLSWPELVMLTGDDSNTYNPRLLRMNWQLYMFFHLAGYDTSFFPKLFGALRNDPMVKTDSNQAFYVLASEDYLKFYQKCCEVSGYDLTEFFELFGFFRLPPELDPITFNGTTYTTYKTFVDYSRYYLLVTQEMIDEALAAVKSKGYKPCNVLFIDDRIRNAEGRMLYPGYVSLYGSTGTMGQWNDYLTEPTGTYSCTISGTSISLTGGTGAVGFKIYDADDNLIFVANDNTFAVSTTIAYGLLAGIYRLVVAYPTSDVTVSSISTDKETFQLRTIVNAYNRGAIFYHPTSSEQWVWSSGVSGTFNANAANCQWILYPTGNSDEYYLYNVGKQQFAVPMTGGTYTVGYTWGFSSTPVGVTLLPQSDGTYHIRTTAGNIYMSVSNNYRGPVISYYSTNDQGVPFGINNVGTASDEVVAQLKAALQLTNTPGDINRDGAITIADFTALVNIILDKVSQGGETHYDYDAADTNLDGKVSTSDFAPLLNIILRQ